MTTDEARELIKKGIPNVRSVCIGMEEWWSEESGRYDRYVVSVFPGRNGDQCQNFQGKTLGRCVSDCLNFKCLNFKAEP